MKYLLLVFVSYPALDVDTSTVQLGIYDSQDNCRDAAVTVARASDRAPERRLSYDCLPIPGPVVDRMLVKPDPIGAS